MGTGGRGVNSSSRVSMSTSYLVTKREIIPALIPGFCGVFIFGLFWILLPYILNYPSLQVISIQWKLFVLAVCLVEYCLIHFVAISFHNSRQKQAMRTLHNSAVVTLRLINNESKTPAEELTPKNDSRGIRRLGNSLPMKVVDSFASTAPEGGCLVFGVVPLFLLYLGWQANANAGLYFCFHQVVAVIISLGSYTAYRVSLPGRVLITPAGFLIVKEMKATFQPWHIHERGEWIDGVSFPSHPEGGISTLSRLKLRLAPNHYLLSPDVEYVVENPTAEERGLLIRTVSANMILDSKSQQGTL